MMGLRPARMAASRLCIRRRPSDACLGRVEYLAEVDLEPLRIVEVEEGHVLQVRGHAGEIFERQFVDERREVFGHALRHREIDVRGGLGGGVPLLANDDHARPHLRRRARLFETAVVDRRPVGG